MMNRLNKFNARSIAKLIALATLTMFSFLALASINSVGQMNMDNTGPMTDCPFMIYQDTLCQMTIAEHIERWQAAVAGLIPYLVVFGVWLIFISALLALTRQKWRHLSRFKCHFRPLWQTGLIKALAGGIIHPKIYPTLIV